MRKLGGGVLLAVSLLAGGAIGASLGQGSLGIIVGLVVGLLLAGFLTLWDIRRRR